MEFGQDGISMTCTEQPCRSHASHLTARSSSVHYVSCLLCCLYVVVLRTCPGIYGVDLTGYTTGYTDSPHRPPAQRIHVYCSCSSIFSSSNQSRSLLTSAPVILFYLHHFYSFRLLAPLFFPLLFLFSPSLPRLASRLQPGEDSFSATVLLQSAQSTDSFIIQFFSSLFLIFLIA